MSKKNPSHCENDSDRGDKIGPSDQTKCYREDDYIARPIMARSSDKERVESDRVCSEMCEMYARLPTHDVVENEDFRGKVLESVECAVGMDKFWLANVRVFGMLGRMGSGKDYVAKHFLKRALREIRGENGTCLTLAFADGLKRESASKYGFDYESLYAKKTKESRFHCQKLGTEYGRNVYGNSVWIRQLLVEMRTHYEVNDVRLFVVTDVRFANEMFALKFLFGDRFESIQVLSRERHLAALNRESGGDSEIAARIEGHVSEKFATEVHASWIDQIFVNEPGQDDTYERFAREMKREDAELLPGVSSPECALT